MVQVLSALYFTIRNIAAQMLGAPLPLQVRWKNCSGDGTSHGTRHFFLPARSMFD